MSVLESAFLLAESREHPMHVGALQLWQPPKNTKPDHLSEVYRELIAPTEVSRTMRRRPHRPATELGLWSWIEDSDVELDYHVRHSALPRPGRVRELLELVSRLHGAPLDRQRPLWEFHLVEGLADGRFATYIKMHHALMDGVTMQRRLTEGLTTNPREKARPPWAPSGQGSSEGSGPLEQIQRGLRLVKDLATTPAEAGMRVARALTESATKLPFDAPRTMFNVQIGGARRFAGQGWSLDRVRSIGKAAEATVNDVAVAMCSGALRRYLLDHDALPDRPLVAALPVSLRGKGNDSHDAEATGIAVGMIMCELATDEPDPAARLSRVRASTRGGKAVLEGLSPTQVMAVLTGLVPGLLLQAVPGVGRLAPPVFNLVISNVPGARETLYWNGAKLLDTYPLSIPTDGLALNITLNSYVDRLEFGVIGCRRSVPGLQRLLDHLDTELTDLERAVL
jgi:WS/DGAT/MGAT family acyltransferase